MCLIKIDMFSLVLRVVMLLAFSVHVYAADEAPKEFDHDTTGFFLTGQHSHLPCETCHVRGIFRGLPKTCEGCHEHFPQITTSMKPLNHVVTNAPCDDCHTDTSWTLVRMDHSSITADCFTCHNNTVQDGKPLDHIESSNNCEECHITIAWTPAGFDHEGISNNCIRCHNNVIAQGKTPDHYPTSDNCEECHSTRAWTPAGFDHPPESAGRCTECHSGDKPADHVTTTDQCDVCHYTTNWSTIKSYDHKPGTAYVGHGGNIGATECGACHAGAGFVDTDGHATSAPSSESNCKACHANDAPSPGHRSGGECGNSGCHRPTDNKWDD